MTGETSLGESVVRGKGHRLRAGLGSRPALHRVAPSEPQFPHPSKERERLTEPLRGPPEAALASPSPAQPIPGLRIRFLPRRAEGITRTGLSRHPSRSGPQSARTTKHWLASLLGIELPMPESDPTMLEVPNSQRAAFSMVGARRGTKGS